MQDRGTLSEGGFITPGGGKKMKENSIISKLNERNLYKVKQALPGGVGAEGLCVMG